jgi:hypothetical protein
MHIQFIAFAVAEFGEVLGSRPCQVAVKNQCFESHLDHNTLMMWTKTALETSVFLAT